MRKKERKLCVMILMMKKRTFKKEYNKRKRERCDNIYDNKREVKKENSSRKKEKHNNLGDNEKENLRQYRKKERKLCMMIVMMKKRNI